VFFDTNVPRDQTVVAKPAVPAAEPIRDMDNRWIVASAIEAGADVLVTGDKDLLSIAARLPLRVVDPRGFWELARAVHD
jgi:predicted nucleic acid-binding protein